MEQTEEGNAGYPRYYMEEGYVWRCRDDKSQSIMINTNFKSSEWGCASSEECDLVDDTKTIPESSLPQWAKDKLALYLNGHPEHAVYPVPPDDSWVDAAAREIAEWGVGDEPSKPLIDGIAERIRKHMGGQA